VFACFVFYGVSYFSDVSVHLKLITYLSMSVEQSKVVSRTDAQKHGKLYWPQMFCLSIGIVIYSIAMGTTNVGARYFAMMWTPVANGTFSSIIYPSPIHPFPSDSVTNV
jgi:hypothetical protein